MDGLRAAQEDVCRRFGAECAPTPLDAILGAALPTLRAGGAIHGLRHALRGASCGWYIWCGDLSADPDFFQPIHAEELTDLAPVVLPYLGLAPGWRFLLTPGYEDAWYDPELLSL
jgi:hypothetical protein